MFAGVALVAACGSTTTVTVGPGGSGRASALRGITTGELSHINGSTLTVAARSGDVTVTTTGSTKVTTTQTASLGDISNGDCVNVGGQPDSSGNVAAVAVSITPSSSGSCVAPAAAVPGGGSRGAPPGTAPGGGSGFGTTRAPRTFGTVSDVTSTGFTVKEASGTSVTVTTSSSTIVTKAASESVSSLKTGVCVVVLGQPLSNTGVAAATISVTPMGANGCAARGFGGGGGGGGFGGFGGGGGGGGGSSNSGSGAPAVGI